MVDLLAKTGALVDIASVSRDEAKIADVVEAQLRSIETLEVTRIENNLIARTNFGRAHRVVLGGHLDTVPPSGNEGARIDGNRCSGVGSCDMKGGIAIMLELAEQMTTAAVDITYVFYACEEIARAESGLLVIERASPNLLQANAAILLEPTGSYVEAGCQGVVRARVDLSGERAHTARPWTGVNAIHRLAKVIEAVAGFEERLPVIDGCEYHESMQSVKVNGGIATNVIPDAAQLEFSMRFAPDRSVEEASDHLRSVIAPAIDTSCGDQLEIVDAAAGALPSLDNPLLHGLVAATNKAPRAKLGWTDVAFFSERNIPATNFGPGDPELAHSKGEFVTRDELESVYASLATLLTSPY